MGLQTNNDEPEDYLLPKGHLGRRMLVDKMLPIDNEGRVDLAQAKQPQTGQEAVAVRGSTHGDFTDNAVLTQQLKDTIRAFTKADGSHPWDSMTPVMREGLDMLFLKVGRAVTGQQDYRDHWVDMAGYPQLVADRCP